MLLLMGGLGAVALRRGVLGVHADAALRLVLGQPVPGLRVPTRRPRSRSRNRTGRTQLRLRFSATATNYLWTDRGASAKLRVEYLP